MKKLLFILILSGCSNAPYIPMADLRNSENANLYNRDLFECETLIEKGINSNSYYSYFSLKDTLTYTQMIDDCLEGRGHTIVNWVQK